MLDSGYFEKKRQELGLDRYDTLQKVQAWLDERYPGQARAVSLNRGVLRIMTVSSSVAADLRLSQISLLGEFTEAERLQISIAKR